MLNPLSIQYGQMCTGKEINDWCRYQIKNNGCHYKDAVKFLKKNYKDDRTYCKCKKAKTGSDDSDVIEFYRIKENEVVV